MTTEQLPERGSLRSDLAFPYRLWRSERPSGEALILLHGSGVDETTMAPLGAEIAPDATRIAVRGRIPQEGGWRWFERITPTVSGSRASGTRPRPLPPSLADAGRSRKLRPRPNSVFLGYSNGANLISSVMLLHPGLIARAALLRCDAGARRRAGDGPVGRGRAGDHRRARRHLRAVRAGARRADVPARRRGRRPHGGRRPRVRRGRRRNCQGMARPGRSGDRLTASVRPADGAGRALAARRRRDDFPGKRGEHRRGRRTSGFFVATPSAIVSTLS